MPKIAIADTLREWESLLAAAAEKGAAIPGVEENVAQLQAALERTRALDALRLRLQAERQQATVDLAASRREGQDLAIGLRGRLVAAFGSRWEGLAQFGIRLRRGRRRSPASRKASSPSPDASQPSTLDNQ